MLYLHLSVLSYGPRREKTCLREFANNKGADQPAHLRSLISTFVIRLLKSIISKPAASKILIFMLVPVAEQAGLNLTLWETPKTCFDALWPLSSLIVRTSHSLNEGLPSKNS